MERLLDPGIEAFVIDQPRLLRAGLEREAGGTEDSPQAVAARRVH